MRNFRTYIGKTAALTSVAILLSLSAGCSSAQPKMWPITYEPDAVEGESDSDFFTVEPSKELGTFEPSFDD